MQNAFAAFVMCGGGDSASDAALQVSYAQAVPFLVCFLILPTLIFKKFTMFSPLDCGEKFVEAARSELDSSSRPREPLIPPTPTRIIMSFSPSLAWFDREMSLIRRRPTSHLTHSRSFRRRCMHRSLQDPPGLPGPDTRDRMGADASLHALCRRCGSFGAAGR
jgi:hypothetical protein